MIDWMLDTLLWTSVLMVLVLVVRAPVAKAFGPRVAYALWALPMARLLMPTLTSTVSRSAPDVSALSASDIGMLPVESIEMSVSLTPLESGSDTVGASAVAAMGEWLQSVDAMLVLLSVWAIGATATFGWHHLRYWRDRRAILASGACRGTVGGIDLVVSPAAPGPMALGIVRRVIALPPAYLDRCSDAELDLALEHELSHHRSGDLWARQAGLVLLALHWFNPIAWKAFAAFHFDQEAACDARVIARRGSGARADYGRAIARSVAPQRILTANARDTDLKRRLMMMKNGSHRPAGLLAIAALAVVLVPATATRAIAYEDDSDMLVTSFGTSAASLTVDTETWTDQVEDDMEEALEDGEMMDAAFHDDVMMDDEAIARDVHPDEHVSIHIDGDKDYSEMTPKERREFDRAIRELRRELRDLRTERPRAEREFRVEMEEARREARQSRAEAQADIEEGRRDIAEAMEEIRREAPAMRARGENPDVALAALRAAEASLNAIDVGAIIEASLSSVDEGVVSASLLAAEEGMAAALRDMEARRNR